MDVPSVLFRRLSGEIFWLSLRRHMPPPSRPKSLGQIQRHLSVSILGFNRNDVQQMQWNHGSCDLTLALQESAADSPHSPKENKDK